MRVVLTQPQPRVAALAINVSAAGHEVTTLGFQRIVERVGEPAIRRQLQQLNEADWIIPVSPNAIDALSSFLGSEAATLDTSVALIGPGSLERWQQVMSPDHWSATSGQPLLPRSDAYDGASLIAEPEFFPVKGKRVVIIQSGERRPSWTDTLVSRGARVEVVAAYQVDSIVPSSDEALQLIAWLSERRQRNDLAIVTSSVAIAQACTNWLRHSIPADWQIALDDCLWLANHVRVEESLRRAGCAWVKTITPGERGLLHALESLG